MAMTCTVCGHYILLNATVSNISHCQADIPVSYSICMISTRLWTQIPVGEIFYMQIHILYVIYITHIIYHNIL